jgi:hypothetical protein
MKCWKSTFNAQRSKLIILALQVGAVKIYASNSEGASLPKEKGKTEWNSVHHKNWGAPPVNANVFNFFESHPIYDQTQGSSAVFLTLYIILLYIFNEQTFLQSQMN